MAFRIKECFVSKINDIKYYGYFIFRCELPWYTVSIQCQKLLQFIMQRSIKNSKFTLFIMDASLERFASVSIMYEKLMFKNIKIITIYNV